MHRPLRTGVGVYHLGVSVQWDGENDVRYRMTRIDRPGDRLQQVEIGLAHPTCAHFECKLANLGAAAVDWAYLLQVEKGLGAFHPEQMGLQLGPE